jgi:hypothetical protein
MVINPCEVLDNIIVREDAGSIFNCVDKQNASGRRGVL